MHIRAKELLLSILILSLGLNVRLKLIDLIHLVLHLVIHQLQILDSLLVLH